MGRRRERGAAARQVRSLHTRRQSKSGAIFAVPRPVYGHIHCHADSLATGFENPIHELFRKATIRLDIELEPKRPRRLAAHCFERYRRKACGHQRGIAQICAFYGLELSLCVNQLVISGRAEQNRIRIVPFEEPQLRIDLAGIHQDPLPQQNALERSPILRVGKSGARSPGDVLIRRVAHAFARELLEVVEGPKRLQGAFI